MSIGLNEWLEDYNKICQQQERYLQRIKDLRNSLENKEDKHAMVAIEKIRGFDLNRKRKNYKSKFVLFDGTALPTRREEFLQRTSPLHNKRQNVFIRANPCLNHEKLPPLDIKGRKANGTINRCDIHKNETCLERMRTDYEPLETIAKRNNLNFSALMENRSRKNGLSTKRQPFGVRNIVVRDLDIDAFEYSSSFGSESVEHFNPGYVAAGDERY